MVLLCEVRGGSPPPKIQWLWNGKPVDSTMLDFSFASTQTSKLVIKNLSRVHQHTIITCRASNFPKTETVSNVTIDLLCKLLLFFETKAKILCRLIHLQIEITWLDNSIIIQYWLERWHFFTLLVGTGSQLVRKMWKQFPCYIDQRWLLNVESVRVACSCQELN